jgi:hypothetical protein
MQRQPLRADDAGLCRGLGWAVIAMSPCMCKIRHIFLAALVVLAVPVTEDEMVLRWEGMNTDSVLRKERP